MQVTLLNHTPEPEKSVCLAARLCYSGNAIAELEEKVRGIDQAGFLNKILGMGHLSILEHASFTFGIDGISRVTSHQLVRHRLASYSQQSQRYVKFGSPEFVLPGSVASDEGRKQRFEAALSSLYTLYNEMVEEGVPAEDARYLLPNAACTKIIVTMNARELLHFFTLRGCERAQWEIREMATEMIVCAKSVAPVIFANTGPACVRESCSEGALTCGRPKEIRAKFKSL